MSKTRKAPISTLLTELGFEDAGEPFPLFHENPFFVDAEFSINEVLFPLRPILLERTRRVYPQELSETSNTIWVSTIPEQ